MKCPCKLCLIKPRCRYKLIEELISQCNLVEEFIEYKTHSNSDVTIDNYYNGFNYNMKKLRKLKYELKPIKWST